MEEPADSAAALHFAGQGATASVGLSMHDATISGDAFAAQGLPSGTDRATLRAAVFKRLMDIGGSLVLLLVLSPLLLLAALMVLRSGRPLLFKQPRVGLHGRIFVCYKFRSMVPDAERRLGELLQQDEGLRQEWQCSQKLRRDPRITRAGVLLRRTSIDELPQLWNVLRGDMSLVGPRPVLVEQLSRYGRLADCYTSMRPGITGLWQVMARGDGDFARRIALDCDYIRNFSVQRDLAILLKTAGVVLRGTGAY